jgi:hypothetical protein
MIDTNGKVVQLRPGEYTCVAVLRALGPGGWATTHLWLEADAPEGDYRLRTSIEIGARSLWWFTYGKSHGYSGDVVTPVFRVARK